MKFNYTLTAPETSSILEISKRTGAVPGSAVNAERGFLIYRVNKPECSIAVRRGAASSMSAIALGHFYVRNIETYWRCLMTQLKKLEDQIDRMCLQLSFLHQQLTIIHTSLPGGHTDKITACIRRQLEAFEALIKSSCDDLRRVKI